MSALRLLDEVAWRVQLLQNHPEIVARIVPFARPPYYANSDDQSLLNDAIVSAVLRNRETAPQISAASRLHFGRTSAASRPHLGRPSAVPRLYLGCTSAVPRLYLGCT